MLRNMAAFLILTCHAETTTPDAISKEILAPLLDPVKVDGLKGPRPINGRAYKVIYWLETARRAGVDVSGVMATAQTAAGYEGTPRAKADAQAIIGNREKIESLGCLTDPGMAELIKGNSPTITKGPEAGRTIHMDHIVPVHIAPELAARFHDLDAISDRENEAKGAKITGRSFRLPGSGTGKACFPLMDSRQ